MSEVCRQQNPDLMAIACKHVAYESGRPVLLAEHGMPLETGDSGWQFLCDLDHTEEEAVVLTLGHIIERHSTLAILKGAPPETEFHRSQQDACWHTTGNAGKQFLNRRNMEVIAATENLLSPDIKTRTKAVMQLRVWRPKESAPRILELLQRELRFPARWHLQRQAILAVGECGYLEGLGFLSELASREWEHQIIVAALGYSVARLEWLKADCRDEALAGAITSSNDMFLQGAIQAALMLRARLSEKLVSELLSSARRSRLDHEPSAWTRIYVAGMAGRWYKTVKSPFLRWRIRRFLVASRKAQHGTLRRVAAAALDGDYVTSFPD